MKTVISVGWKVAVGIIAILIILALISIDAPPFSLLKPEAEATDSAEVAPQMIQAPASTVGTSGTEGKRFLIVAPESFDQVLKVGEAIQPKTVTLINSSDQPVPVFLFVQGVDTCSKLGEDAEKCVDFKPEVEVEKSLPVIFDFTKLKLETDKPITGKIIIAGGEIQQEFPFSIKSEEKPLGFSEAVQQTIASIFGQDKWPNGPFDYSQAGQQTIASMFGQGEWPNGSFNYSQAGQRILTLALGLVVFLILFPVLYSKVFPSMRRERSLPLMMDVTDDTKALWSVFSSRLTEMKEQDYGHNLVNPRPKDDQNIDLPTNLGKEGDIFKTVVDLLSWILPRRGNTIRILSLENQTKGKGISVKVVRNNDNYVLAERLFWAGDYGLSAQTGDTEYILMTAVILWLSHWQAKQTPPQKENGEAAWEWEVRAFSELARILWGQNRSLAKRMYTEAVFLDPANRQAQSGLGRIWLEESQQADNTDHETQDCLDFAIWYLKEVCRQEPEPRDVLWFAAKYNLAVAQYYKKKTTDAVKSCVVLFEKIDVLIPTLGGKKQTGRIDDSDSNFRDWLLKFRSMAWIFKNSMELEVAKPGNKMELDAKVCKMIKGLKLMLGRTPENTSDQSEDLPSSGWLLVNLDYRSQYNAACYFSRCYRLAKESSNKKFPDKELYAKTALDYLRLALGHGGGLASYARVDEVLQPLREKDYGKEFDDIAKETPKAPEKTDETVLRLVVDKPIVIQSD
jgi:hypothetical protein